MRKTSPKKENIPKEILKKNIKKNKSKKKNLKEFNTEAILSKPVFIFYIHG